MITITIQPVTAAQTTAAAKLLIDWANALSDTTAASSDPTAPVNSLDEQQIDAAAQEETHQATSDTSAAPAPRRGRPPGSKNAPKTDAATASAVASVEAPVEPTAPVVEPAPSTNVVPLPTPTTAPAPTALTLQDVRALLGEVSKSGKTAEVRALLADFGATNLTALSADRYPELVAKAKAL